MITGEAPARLNSSQATACNACVPLARLLVFQMNTGFACRL